MSAPVRTRLQIARAISLVVMERQPRRTEVRVRFDADGPDQELKFRTARYYELEPGAPPAGPLPGWVRVPIGAGVESYLASASPDAFARAVGLLLDGVMLGPDQAEPEEAPSAPSPAPPPARRAFALDGAMPGTAPAAAPTREALSDYWVRDWCWQCKGKGCPVCERARRALLRGDTICARCSGTSTPGTCDNCGGKGYGLHLEAPPAQIPVAPDPGNAFTTTDTGGWMDITLPHFPPDDALLHFHTDRPNVRAWFRGNLVLTLTGLQPGEQRLLRVGTGAVTVVRVPRP